MAVSSASCWGGLCLDGYVTTLGIDRNLYVNGKNVTVVVREMSLVFFFQKKKFTCTYSGTGLVYIKDYIKAPNAMTFTRPQADDMGKLT